MSIPLLLAKRGFHPRQLFSALQGAWLEPTVGSIWQENTGVTPTTTSGQTIGRIADLSGYGNAATQATAANRPTYQLDSNGLPLARHDTTDSLTVSLPSINVRRNLLYYSDRFDITTHIAGSRWSLHGTTAVYNTKIYGGLTGSTFTPSGTNAYLYKASTGSPLLAPGTYTFSVLAAGTSIVNMGVYDADLGYWQGITVQLTAWPTRYTFTATVTTFTLQIGIGRIGGVGGSTAGAFDLYYMQVEAGSVATDYQKITDWTSEAYASSGSVYFATPVGMSALHNQSMGTTYTLPALSSDIYSWIVVQQRLSAVQESRLSRYMRQRAGIAEDDYLWESFRRNLLTWSEDCSKAEWFKIGTLSLSSEIAPNGNAAYLLTETTATDYFTLGRNAFTVGIGTALTVTYFIKANNATRTFLVAPQGTGGHTKGIMVGNDGAYLGEYTGTGTITSYVITVLPNSWLKVSISWTSQMNDAYPFVRLLSGGTTPYIGDGTSGFYVGGFQLERGSVATPYQRIDAGPDPYTIMQEQLTNDDGEQLLLAQ